MPGPTHSEPSKKMHLSQQLERAAKDIGVMGVRPEKCFDVLLQSDSYPNKSMRTNSITSVKGPIKMNLSIKWPAVTVPTIMVGNVGCD
jgi:hypothetical protein